MKTLEYIQSSGNELNHMWPKLLDVVCALCPEWPEPPHPVSTSSPSEESAELCSGLTRGNKPCGKRPGHVGAHSEHMNIVDLDSVEVLRRMRREFNDECSAHQATTLLLDAARAIDVDGDKAIAIVEKFVANLEAETGARVEAEHEKEIERAFTRGVCAAAAQTIRHQVNASDILRSIGATEKDLVDARVDDFDMIELRPILRKAERARKERDG